MAGRVRAVAGMLTLVAGLMGGGPAAATSGPPSLSAGDAARGDGTNVDVTGLTPGAPYVLAADHALFGSAPTRTATADADGNVVAAVTIPQDVPVTVDSYRVSVTPEASTSAVVTGSGRIIAPELRTESACPGASTPVAVELHGFPPGSYDLTSPHATFTPARVAVDASGGTGSVAMTVSASAPNPFTATETPVTVPAAAADSTVYLAEPATYPVDWIHRRPPVVGTCFHPDTAVTLRAEPPGLLTVPSSVTADAEGRVSFVPRTVAGPSDRIYRIDATDALGSSVTFEGDVPGTTWTADQDLRGAVVSAPHLGYATWRSGCSLRTVRWDDTAHTATTVWTSGAPLVSVCTLQLTTDGELQIRYGTSLVWRNGAQATGSANTVALDDTGDLVERTSSGQVVWSSRYGRHVLTVGQRLTSGQQLLYATTTLSMQRNGNLVLRRDGRGLWNTHTAGSGATRLAMRPNGNLVLKTADGRIVWRSHTLGTGTANRLLLVVGHLAIVTAAGHIVWYV